MPVLNRFATPVALALALFSGPAFAQAESTAPIVKNSVAAAVLAPERCAVEVAPKAEGKAAAETGDKPCADLADAVPTIMTPNGPVPLAQDAGTNATEDALLLRLGERNQQLDQQAQSLDQQAALLEAAQKRLDERTSQLTALEASIGAMVDQKNQQSQQMIAEMVALYSNMKPVDAAVVLSGLPDPVLKQIATGMSPRKLSPIVAAMDPARAQALTVLMMPVDNPAMQ